MVCRPLLGSIGFMLVGALAQTKLFTCRATHCDMVVTTWLIAKSTRCALFARWARLPILSAKRNPRMLLLSLRKDMNLGETVVEWLNVPSCLYGRFLVVVRCRRLWVAKLTFSFILPQQWRVKCLVTSPFMWLTCIISLYLQRILREKVGTQNGLPPCSSVALGPRN